MHHSQAPGPIAASLVVLNGAYHFVMPNEDLDQQTAVFAGQVGVVRPGNLPPCLDFEWTRKRTVRET